MAQKIWIVLSLVCLWGGVFAYKKKETLSLAWALRGSLPLWAKAQIANDLAPFREGGVTQEALEETFSKTVQEPSVAVYRYRFCEGKIFRKPAEFLPADFLHQARAYDKMFLRLQKSRKLPFADFLLCTMDGVPQFNVPSRFWVTERQAPLFCMAKELSAPHLILLPDHFTTKESGWHVEIGKVERMYREIPWEERKEKAFWRGAPSDKVYTETNYATRPRCRLCLLAQEKGEVVDAGFFKDVETQPHLLSSLGLVLGRASVEEHLGFKYLPVLDGYMCTYPGFPWRLLSGSLTLKQESDEVQYFYSALEPFVHYVPIKNDMSDLVEKIAWAKEHDAECRKIAENARAFARENLMPNAIYNYLYKVIEEYSQLQKFDHFEMDDSWLQVQ